MKRYLYILLQDIVMFRLIVVRDNIRKATANITVLQAKQQSSAVDVAYRSELRKKEKQLEERHQEITKKLAAIETNLPVRKAI